MTRAPCQVAICTAAWPTLPLTPITNTVSPVFGMPARRRPSIAVTKGTPMPAPASRAVAPPPQPGPPGLRHAGRAQAFHRGEKGHADAGRLLPRNRARLVDD